jgi:uncharacterized protein
MGEDQNVEPVEQPLDQIQVPEPGFAVRKIFRNRFHHWRAAWRILVFSILVFLGAMLMSVVIRMLAPERDGGMMSWGYLLTMACFDLMLIGIACVVLWLFDRRPSALLGVGFERGWWRELGVGVAAGVVTTGGLTLVLVVSGVVSLEISPRLSEALAVMPRFLLLFTVAGAAEELIFRGYILQALAEGSRRWIAAVLTSLPFAIVHLDNPDVTVVGIANIFLVGLVFAVFYFQTLRLWLPIGFHLSWNWAHGWLWGFDVSGIELEHQVFIATPHGPDLLTGGGFGLEGSIVTTLLIVAAGCWLLTKKVLAPSDEMVALWAPYPRGFGVAPVETDENSPVEEEPSVGVPEISGEDESEN